MFSDELLSVLHSSESLAEALRYFGYSGNGSGAYRSFKNQVEQRGLSIPDYHPGGSGGNFQKKPLSEYLTENSITNVANLKKRLVQEGLLDYKCYKCGISEWLGQRIGLQLDHVNGCNTDNRFENLRFLCPNCHSQTSTFAGRNRSRTKRVSKRDQQSLEIANRKKVRLEKTINSLVTADIDYSKFGWVRKAAVVIGIREQKICGWMRRNAPDFYQQCFRKKLRGNAASL